MARKKKPKSDTAEVAKRVDEVLRIRLDGAQFHDVVQYAAEKGWGINERQIRTYMKRADALLVERQDRKRKPLIARRIAQREALFARAVNAADLRTALAILDSADKLRGLFTDPKEMRELSRLVSAMTARIADLERRLADAQRNQDPTEARGPQTGAARGNDAGGTAGAD
jgi:3-dehydroquinate synthase class II